MDEYVRNKGLPGPGERKVIGPTHSEPSGSSLSKPFFSTLENKELIINNVRFAQPSSEPNDNPKPKASLKQNTYLGSHSAHLVGQAIRWEYIYGFMGLILGLSCIVGGVVLGLNGVAGSTSWSAKLLALESQINDAAPGVVLFIVGIFLVRITKPKVRMHEGYTWVIPDRRKPYNSRIQSDLGPVSVSSQQRNGCLTTH